MMPTSCLRLWGQKAARPISSSTWCPDTLFPIGYALIFAFISAWFLVRLLPLDHRLQWLSMIPLISGLADVLENLLLVIAT